MYRWELDHPADIQLSEMPAHVQPALSDFMDAVVLVDPMEYRREPGEPDKPLRTLSFGPDDNGLVTFLVYAPDDLVLVVNVQWLGE